MFPPPARVWPRAKDSDTALSFRDDWATVSVSSRCMFTHLTQLVTGRVPSPALGFVEEVRVHEPRRRNPRVEKFILVCWVLIAIKHVAIIWAVRHYPVPFHQLW